MIKINVVAVGKVKEKYYREGIDEYLKRLSRFAEVTITEIKEENYSPENPYLTLKKEGEAIRKELKGYTVAMAVEGKQISSEDFAKFFENTAKTSSVITFVIGGSYGIDEEVKKSCDLKISLSKMTLPHTLCRLVLVEQIYRAFMINSNSTYHK